MTTWTRLTTRLGVVAVLALVLALTPTMGFASAEDDARTCRDLPAYTENLEGNTTGVWGSATFSQDSGPLVLEVNDGYTVWVCVKKGSAAQEFGPVEVGPYVGPLTGVDVSYPGTPPAEGFSHYAIRWEPEGELKTFKVIPKKVWDFGKAAIPADGEAVITIDAGVHGSKSWSFDTSGAMTSTDKSALRLPEGATYEVTEVVTAPAGFTCERFVPEVDAMHRVRPEVVTETVHNRCVERSTDTLPPVTFPPATVTTPELQTTTTTTAEVAGEVVEATTTTAEVAGEVAAAALPRTGGSAALGLMAVGLLAAGGGLVATARRRELKS
jgi:LPXTG-motif cell wall-anchored protein